MTVKLHAQYFGLLISITFAAQAASFAAGQDCPCNGSRAAFHGDSQESIRPDLLPGSPISDEVEPGIGNSVAACVTPFCDCTCRSEGIYFSVEEVLIDVFQPDNGIAPRLLNAKIPMAPKLDNLDPD